ncbi:MAG: hypothetical protein QF473_36935, partial [Planctomycetota bacterium]|nr:hypothetical protein [Planctomycetota bacterium]
MEQQEQSFKDNALEKIEQVGEKLNKVAEVVVNGIKVVFGSRNDRLVREMCQASEQINALEKDMVHLSDAELSGRTEEFRKRLADGETLDDLLPDAFAVAREASKRVLRTRDSDPVHMRHFDVQL